MNYLVRGIDTKNWKKARIKAIKEDLRMPYVIVTLIEMWVKGEIDIVRDRSKEKQGG